MCCGITSRSTPTNGSCSPAAGRSTDTPTGSLGPSSPPSANSLFWILTTTTRAIRSMPRPAWRWRRARRACLGPPGRHGDIVAARTAWSSRRDPPPPAPSLVVKCAVALGGDRGAGDGAVADRTPRAATRFGPARSSCSATTRRRAATRGCSGRLRSVRSSGWWSAGCRVSADRTLAGMTLYPQARASIDGQVKVPLSVDRLDESRSSMVDAVALEVGAGPELASVLDVDAAGVGARLYRPDTAGGAAVVVYLHGGGWVLGDLETHDGLCRLLADRSGCAVLAVDYRLAPEHPYPAAFDDLERAVGFVPTGRTATASTRPGWRSRVTPPVGTWPPWVPAGPATAASRTPTRCSPVP